MLIIKHSPAKITKTIMYIAKAKTTPPCKRNMRLMHLKVVQFQVCSLRKVYRIFGAKIVKLTVHKGQSLRRLRICYNTGWLVTTKESTLAAKNMATQRSFRINPRTASASSWSCESRDLQSI